MVRQKSRLTAFQRISARSDLAAPYISHRVIPAAMSRKKSADTSFADLLCNILITWGMELLVVRAPATSPIITVESIGTGYQYNLDIFYPHCSFTGKCLASIDSKSLDSTNHMSSWTLQNVRSFGSTSSFNA